MTFRKAARRLMTFLTPWTPRHERKAARRRARAALEGAAERLASAQEVQQQIGRLVYADNHIAAALADTLRHHREGDR